MEVVNQILLVDKDTATNTETDNKIKGSRITKNVKVALNGGHALLYLEQINDRLNESNLVILLGMDMPIMNGYEFLNSYFSCKFLNRDKILLIVLKDNLTDEKIAFLKAKGVNNFITKDFEPKALELVISSHFNIAKENSNSNNVKMRNKINNSPTFQRMNAA